MEFDHYNISNKRANLDICSVAIAIAQQLCSASQAFLSTEAPLHKHCAFAAREWVRARL